MKMLTSQVFGLQFPGCVQRIVQCDDIVGVPTEDVRIYRSEDDRRHDFECIGDTYTRAIARQICVADWFGFYLSDMYRMQRVNDIVSFQRFQLLQAARLGDFDALRRCAHIYLREGAQNVGKCRSSSAPGATT